MASTWPTINALKISQLFIATPHKSRCAYEVKKQLGMPEESARRALKMMRNNAWLSSEHESTGRRTLYQITEHGRISAMSALDSLRLPVQALFPST